MPELQTFAPTVLFLASLVWALTQVLKNFVSVNPQAIALGASVLIGGAYYGGFIPAQLIEQVGQVVLAALAAYGIHNYLYKPPAPAGK